MQRQLMTDIFLFLRLSNVRIFPLVAVQVKKATLEGAFTFQISKVKNDFLQALKLITFVWTTALRKILVVDNLIRCGMILLAGCTMHKSNGENTYHFTCWGAMSKIFAFESNWVMPKLVGELQQCWKGSQSLSKLDYTILFHCLIWKLWK